MKDVKPARNIDEYIASFPPHVQKVLEEIRKAIRSAAPGATEKISYGMPAFALNGILVYFAAHKNHIGFYPTASGITHFIEDFKGMEYSKGAVQFPLDKPIPFELITKIVTYRVKENLNRGINRDH